MKRASIVALSLVATILFGFGSKAHADEVVIREHVHHPHRVVVVHHRPYHHHHYYHRAYVEPRAEVVVH